MSDQDVKESHTFEPLTLECAHAEILELLARNTPDDFYPSPSHVEAIHNGLTNILSRLSMGFQLDAKLWRTLETRCTWIGIQPIPSRSIQPVVPDDEMHAYDPRHLKFRQQMRDYVEMLSNRKHG